MCNIHKQLKEIHASSTDDGYTESCMYRKYCGAYASCSASQNGRARSIPMSTILPKQEYYLR